MKTFSWAIIMITLLTLVSCTKENDNPVTSNTMLPKKIVVTFDREVLTYDYSYNGNKLTQVVEGSNKLLYTYTGDLITREDLYEDNRLDERKEFTYENNKVKSTISYYTIEKLVNQIPRTINVQRKELYTYNTDGTVLIKRFEIHDNDNIERNNASSLLTILNGNIVKEIYNYEPSVEKRTSSYEYDNKNNCTKNIIGLDKSFSGQFFTDFETRLSNNNPVRSTKLYERNGAPIPNEPIESNTLEYKYNDANFPTESKEYSNGKLLNSTQFFY